MNITLIVRSRVLFKKMSALHNNLKPEGLMEIQGTQVHSKSAKWLSKRWCRQTASKYLSAFKIGKFVNESQLNAALEARKFIFTKIQGLRSQDFQNYCMRVRKYHRWETLPIRALSWPQDWCFWMVSNDFIFLPTLHHTHFTRPQMTSKWKYQISFRLWFHQQIRI